MNSLVKSDGPRNTKMADEIAAESAYPGAPNHQKRLVHSQCPCSREEVLPLPWKWPDARNWLPSPGNGTTKGHVPGETRSVWDTSHVTEPVHRFHPNQRSKLDSGPLRNCVSPTFTPKSWSPTFQNVVLFGYSNPNYYCRMSSVG